MNEPTYDDLCKRLIAERFNPPPPRQPRQPPRTLGSRALVAATNEARLRRST